MKAPTPAEVLKREQARAKREKLELALAMQLRALGLTEGLERQWLFHDTRKFRFDFAYPAVKLAVEVDGGTWTQGRHTRGAGILADCEKSACAAILGWRVIHCVTNQVDSGEAAFWIEQALAAPAWTVTGGCGYV